MRTEKGEGLLGSPVQVPNASRPRDDGAAAPHEARVVRRRAAASQWQGAIGKLPADAHPQSKQPPQATLILDSLGIQRRDPDREPNVLELPVKELLTGSGNSG